MKHIKLIIITIVLSFIAGFVIWQLTWMSELKSEFRTKEKAGDTEQKEQVKVDKVPRNGTVKKRPADTLPGEPARVKKASPQAELPEMIPEKKELLETRHVTSGQLSPETSRPSQEKGLNRIPAESGRADADGETVNPQLQYDEDRTAIVTIKGTSKKTLRSIPGQSVPQINRDTISRHSTSTAPY